MRKIFLLALISVLLFHLYAYAVEFPIFDLRNRIYEESKQIKTLLPTSKDAMLLLSMFDSCIITIQQLDAYFYMLGIFETIKKEDATNASVDYLVTWLNEIKNTNAINVKTLNNISIPTEQPTSDQISKLKANFLELNMRIDHELSKLTTIKSALKVKPKKK